MCRVFFWAIALLFLGNVCGLRGALYRGVRSPGGLSPMYPPGYQEFMRFGRSLPGAHQNFIRGRREDFQANDDYSHEVEALRFG